MIIKSLQLCNFRQYKGEQPPIQFSTDTDKNVTVILGVNTSGKTTLIQAFRWCLYGDCNYKPKEILNADVEEQMDAFQKRHVFVELILFHEGREYTIRRSQDFQKTERFALKLDEPKLKIQYKEDNGEEQPVPFEERKDTIEKILPMGLSDYFFFDGERIADINKRGDVVAAVRGLMGIDVIGAGRDRLDPNRADSVTSKFEKELDLGSNTRDIKLKSDLINAKEKREELIQRRDAAKEQIVFFEKRKEDLATKLRENQRSKQLQQDREALEKDLKIAESNVASYERRLKDDFAKGALRFFSQPLIGRALEVIKNSKTDGIGIPEMRQGAIDHILERMRCLCGLDLKENEGAVKKIKHERSLLPPENIGTTMRDMKTHLEHYQINAKGFVESTRQNHVAYASNLNYIDGKHKELENKSKEIDDAGGVDIAKIEDDYRNNDRMLYEKRNDYDRLNTKIGEVDKEIKDLEHSIEGLVTSTTKNKRLQLCIAYSRSIFEWFDKSYQEKEKEVKERLLESVNSIFEQMYHGQRSVTINDKYQITLLAQLESSQRSTDESKGLEAVKNFSFITGLVDLARQKLRSKDDDAIDDEIAKSIEPVPLVMDAPFSNADEIHISRISSIIPSIAEQVILIVMKKDWEYAKETMNDKVGKLYVIEKVNNSETSSVIRGGGSNV
jgi:DNA sulfur modification protein DndD